MAADTRENSADSSPTPPPGATAPPEHIQSAKPKVYEVFHSSNPTASSSTSPRPESANDLPLSASQNTAGANNEQLKPTLTNALKTVRLEDFKQVHMYPCVRDSLLTGIGAGFGVGGLRALLGGK